MVVASLIHRVGEFFLTGLISSAIVVATIRAYFAKSLTFMEAAGFSSLFIISLLSVLSIYGCIAAIRCWTWCQHESADEESGVVGEDIVSNSKFMSPIFLDLRWDGRRRLTLYEGRRGIIKLVDEPSGSPLRRERW